MSERHNTVKRALVHEMERSGGGWNADRMARCALVVIGVPPEPDPLLTDPRLPDALAESIRAQLGETVYQLRHAVGEIAA